MAFGQPKFAKGDKVFLVADASQRGVVTEGPRLQRDYWEYEVHFSGAERWFAEPQLEPLRNERVPRWVEHQDELLVHLVQAKLEHPLTDALYSYRASRTEFEAYQFRPALKFLRNGGRGILIADEVGLGKTIEAAIIYLELKARVDASRILILCPSRLCQKWHDELQNRFEEDFEILTAERVRTLIKAFQDGFTRDVKAIASFEVMRQPAFYQTWAELGIPLDLLIVDEAHHARNKETHTYHLVLALTQIADSSVFLTATPLHLGNEDLFNLLNLLAPDEFEDRGLFADQIEPNQYINAAAKHVAASRYDEALRTLRKVETTRFRHRFLRNPYYEDSISNLAAARATLPARRSEAIAIQRALMDLNTLSGVLSRTRKREMAKAAIRSAHTIRVDLTCEERALYESVLNRVSENVRENSRRIPGFAAIMEERQAASCLPVIAAKVLSNERVQSTSVEVDESPFELAVKDGAPLRPASRVEVDSARRIGAVDTKFDLLRNLLSEVVAEGSASKVLLFSFFRGTLAYLEKRLKEAGFSPLVLNGDVKMADRYRIIDEFKSQESRRILLSSEVGAEGLDFQFCDVLVNYDLPWNPMQVEQRIGRLDRYGQQHEKIRIFNFYIDDTIETRIFERLYKRIRLFEQSIGDLEVILGEEIGQLTQRVLSGRLTPEEEARLASEAADRIMRKQQAEDDLEQDRDALIGQSAILDQWVEGTISSGRYVSGAEVSALVYMFIRDRFPATRITVDPDELCAVVDMDPSLLGHLRSTIERSRLHSRVTPMLSGALSGSRRLRLTFDNEMARQSKELDFITVSHPLAVAARGYWASIPLSGLPCGRLEIAGPESESGIGSFFVYEVRVDAAIEDTTLQAVIVLDDGRIAESSSRSLLQRIQQQNSTPRSVEPDSDLVSRMVSIADSKIAELRIHLEREARKRNDAALIARETALRNSFQAKIDRTSRLRAANSDERIRRMYASQVTSLSARLDAKLDALRQRKDVSVSSRLIFAGRVKIHPEVPVVEVSEDAGPARTSVALRIARPLSEQDQLSREVLPKRIVEVPEPQVQTLEDRRLPDESPKGNQRGVFKRLRRWLTGEKA